MAVSGKHRVLIVDDAPQLRELLSVALTEAGFDVQEAQDGVDALAKLRGPTPNVIISDLQMPRMAGPEFISVVRHRFPHIPVVVLSGETQSYHLSQEIMADLWLEKGKLQIKELCDSLVDLIRKSPLPQRALPENDNPFRARRTGLGFLVIVCTDCLRSFRIPDTRTMGTGDGTATCVCCDAQVKFLTDEPAPTPSRQKRFVAAPPSPGNASL
jgi:CheY-like chemotaxis protein